LSSETVDICLAALLNPGDNLLTPCPDYPLYSAVLAKLDLKLNAYYLNEEDGWQPDLEDIRKKITPRTRGIVLINPNNPTGSVCTRKMLEEIAELARRHNLVIFADEIYDKLIVDDDPHVAMAAVAPDVPVITFGGLSKNYLAPGWRIGWGIASGEASVIKPYVDGINKLLRARLCANHPEQYAIPAALDGPQDHLVEVKRKLRSRRDLGHLLAALGQRRLDALSRAGDRLDHVVDAGGEELRPAREVVRAPNRCRDSGGVVLEVLRGIAWLCRAARAIVQVIETGTRAQFPGTMQLKARA